MSFRQEKNPLLHLTEAENVELIPQLTQLVDAETTSDVTTDIIRCLPPFSAIGMFFTQRSFYWRSYFYRQQLIYVRSICDDEAQERLLTNLLINLSLLTKDLSTQSLADRAHWISYLKEYSKDQSLTTKNRLLANALWFALDVKHTQAQWNKFILLLQTYCLMNKPLKTNFYYSLLLIVSRVCGDELVVEESRKKLDLAEVLDPDENVIETFHEAQIILAPYAAQFRVANGEILDEIEGILEGDEVTSGALEGYEMNYICLLHAAVQLIPIVSPFWQNSKRVFGYLSKYLPLLYEQSIISPFNYERMNLLITLMSRTGFNAEAEPWKTRLRCRSCDLCEDLFWGLLRDAAKMVCLYKSNDEARQNWLKEVFQAEHTHVALFYFAPRVCAGLKTDTARRAAVDVLMGFEERKQSGYRSQNITSNLIRTLVRTQQMSDDKLEAAKKHFETACYATYPDMHVLIPVFDFLGDEVYQGVNDRWQKPRDFMYVHVSQLIKTLPGITERLAWLRENLDGNSQRNDAHYRSAAAYTVLLCKQADKLEIAKWNYQLASDFIANPNCNLELFNIMLPYLALDDKIKCMNLVWRFYCEGKTLAEARQNPIFLEFVAIVLSVLPIEERKKYSEKIATFFFTPPLESSYSLRPNYNVEGHINLFQQLCDEHIPLLVQRLSFTNNNQLMPPGGCF